MQDGPATLELRVPGIAETFGGFTGRCWGEAEIDIAKDALKLGAAIIGQGDGVAIGVVFHYCTILELLGNIGAELIAFILPEVSHHPTTFEIVEGIAGST